MAKNYKKEEVLTAVNNSAGVMEYVAVKLNCDCLLYTSDAADE